MTPLDIAALFAPPRDSITWAKEAARKLDIEATRFFKTNPTSVITELDANTGENVQKVRITKDIPKDIIRFATEAINNTKNAFDQSTFACLTALLGHEPASRDTFFPWGTDLSNFNEVYKRRKIDERLKDVFAKQEPYYRSEAYSGGNDIVRAVAKIANSKHTVGFYVEAIPCGMGVEGEIRTDGPMDVFLPRWNAEKNEAEFMRWKGCPKIDANYSFAFQILFKESPLPHPVNAVTGIGAFIKSADEFTDMAQGRCLELLSE